MSLPQKYPMRVAHDETVQVPSVGFGTWAADESQWAKDATLAALKAGYRHLDCAWKYGVDQAIGTAIRESGIPRSEIFITTKFWPHFAAPHNVAKCLDLVLDNMGLDYVDLYLAHWPVAFQAASYIDSAKAYPTSTAREIGVGTDETGKEVVDLQHSCRNIAEAGGVHGSFTPTWRAMENVVRSGKARAIGVSNFSIAQLEEVLPEVGDIPISCNQVEAHPWLPNDELITFMKSKGILPTVYSPFAGQKADGATLLLDETVKAVAERNGMGVGQALQSWAVMRETIPLGKSSSPDRIKANLSVKELPKDDFDALSNLKLNGDEGRTIDYSEDWGIKLFV
ncbi:MAG: hypothetical protein M1833_001510 [Piccolia ochrophora]|nr:MAG: hypothetical protein M1833_001510 [Piccolia ochrophora]